MASPLANEVVRRVITDKSPYDIVELALRPATQDKTETLEVSVRNRRADPKTLAMPLEDALSLVFPELWTKDEPVAEGGDRPKGSLAGYVDALTLENEIMIQDVPQSEKARFFDLGRRVQKGG